MTTAVSMDFNNGYFLPVLAGLKTFGNSYLDFTFGTRNEVFAEELGKLIRGTEAAPGTGLSGFWGKVGTAWASSAPKEPISFWSSTCNALKSIPEELKAAEGAKGALGVIWKRMPLIGNLIYVATEIPNLWRAFTSPQGGLLTGAVETVKVGIKAAGFAAGMAIGTALGGPIGGIVGSLVGGWIAGKITGKSFTEKRDEAAQAQPQAAVPQMIPMPGQYPQVAYQPQFTGLTSGTSQTQATQSGQTAQTQKIASNSIFPGFMPELNMAGMPGFDSGFSADIMSPFNRGPKTNNFQRQA